MIPSGEGIPHVKEEFNNSLQTVILFHKLLSMYTRKLHYHDEIICDQMINADTCKTFTEGTYEYVYFLSRAYS